MKTLPSLLLFFFIAHTGTAEPSSDFWRAATPQELAFDEEWMVQKEEDGLVWKEFYFTSEVASGTPCRVYAIFGVPKSASKVPAILYIHGGGGTADPSTVKAWAKNGYACLSFDWTGSPKGKHFARQQFSRFGDRTDLDSQAAIFAPPIEKSRVRLALVAARRAISWLQQCPGVDADKIGVEGISWGGFQSLILSGMDDRVKAVVDIYGAGFYQEFGVNGGCFGLTGPLQFQPPEARKAWLDHFDPQHYVGQATAPTLMLTGTKDMFFWLPLAMRTHEALPTEKRLWLEPNVNHTIQRETQRKAALGWFDFYLRGQGKALPQITAFHTERSEVSFQTAPDSGVKSACVNYIWLKAPPDKVSIGAYAGKEALWESIEATNAPSGEEWRATLPTAPGEARSVAVFATVETSDGMKSSSAMKVLEATSIYTEVSIQKLQEIHACTHPAAD